MTTEASALPEREERDIELLRLSTAYEVSSSAPNLYKANDIT
jgi:hypothetical protein